MNHEEDEEFKLNGLHSYEYYHGDPIDLTEQEPIDLTGAAEQEPIDLTEAEDQNQGKSSYHGDNSWATPLVCRHVPKGCWTRLSQK